MHKSIKIQSFNLTKNHVFIVCGIYAEYMLHKRSVKHVKIGLNPLYFGCFSHTGKYILSCYGYLRNEPRGVTQAMSGGRAELPKFVQSAQKTVNLTKSGKAPVAKGSCHRTVTEGLYQSTELDHVKRDSFLHRYP